MKGLTFKKVESKDNENGLGYDIIRILDVRISHYIKREPSHREVETRVKYITQVCYEYVTICDGDCTILQGIDLEECINYGCYEIEEIT